MSWDYSNQTGDSAVYETRQALSMNNKNKRGLGDIGYIVSGGSTIYGDNRDKNDFGNTVASGASEVGSSVWSGVKEAGSIVGDYAKAPLKIIEVAEIGLLVIAGILAFGVFRSLSQSSVSNIGDGVSKVITSAK
jgi:hypothetical protein